MLTEKERFEAAFDDGTDSDADPSNDMTTQLNAQREKHGGKLGPGEAYRTMDNEKDPVAYFEVVKEAI